MVANSPLEMEVGNKIRVWWATAGDVQSLDVLDKPSNRYYDAIAQVFDAADIPRKENVG
jgi:hypothetical protein